MARKKEPLCPLIKKECLEHDCQWYILVRGTHPNTGAEIDHHDCAIKWMPVLMIENSQQQRSTGAAVESFRNEMVKSNQATANLLMATSDNLRLKGD